MMHTWFEVSIKYQKIAENGMEKKTTEKYLLTVFLLQKAKEDALRK